MGFVNADWWPTTSLIVPQLAAYFGIATIVISLPLYIFAKDSTARWASLASYLLMLTTAALIINDTGHVSSPLIVL